MKPRLSALDLSRLPLRLQVVASILEAGRPLTLDDVLCRLAEAGSVPRDGLSSLRRACRTESCLVHEPDGRLDVDERHPGYLDDRARILRASRGRAGRPRRADPPGRLSPPTGGLDAWCAVRRCDRKAPRVSSTWLGTRRGVGPLGAGEGDQDLLVWLDTSRGQVRAFDVVPSGQAPEALAALLETAIHKPLDPCRPAAPQVVAVDVTEGRLAVERTIEAHGGELVDLDVSPLDAVVARLRRELLSPAMSIADLDAAPLRAFYGACRTLLARLPWRGVRLHESLRLQGLDPSPLYVLLVEGANQGLVVFLEEQAALDTLLTRQPPSAPSLMVRFHPRTAVPAAAVAAEAHGWDEGGRSLSDLQHALQVPLPMHLEGEKARLVSADELFLLNAVIEAVNALTFDAPFLDQGVTLADGRQVVATWPLLASPFGRKRG